MLLSTQHSRRKSSIPPCHPDSRVVGRPHRPHTTSQPLERNVQIDRLGDAKLPVRQTASQVLHALMDTQTLPAVLERLDKAFTHKNGRVKESVLATLTDYIQANGLAGLSSKDVAALLLDPLVECLSDSSNPVRALAQDAFVAMHEIIGDALPRLLEGYSIRPAQMRELQQRFDDSAASKYDNAAETRCARYSHHHGCCSCCFRARHVTPHLYNHTQWRQCQPPLHMSRNHLNNWNQEICSL
jgi:hypothetical protein